MKQSLWIGFGKSQFSVQKTYRNVCCIKVMLWDGLHQVKTKEIRNHVISISIDFYDFITLLCPRFSFWDDISNTQEIVSSHFITLQTSSISTLFSALGNVMKHSLLCLIYYFKFSINVLKLLFCYLRQGQQNRLILNESVDFCVCLVV